MKNTEIRVGGHYLTRSVRRRTIFGVRRTRGEVEVLARVGEILYVKWLMIDGSERVEHGLPACMTARQLAARVD